MGSWCLSVTRATCEGRDASVLTLKAVGGGGAGEFKFHGSSLFAREEANTIEGKSSVVPQGVVPHSKDGMGSCPWEGPMHLPGCLEESLS